MFSSATNSTNMFNRTSNAAQVSLPGTASDNVGSKQGQTKVVLSDAANSQIKAMSKSAISPKESKDNSNMFNNDHNLFGGTSRCASNNMFSNCQQPLFGSKSISAQNLFGRPNTSIETNVFSRKPVQQPKKVEQIKKTQSDMPNKNHFHAKESNKAQELVNAGRNFVQIKKESVFSNVQNQNNSKTNIFLQEKQPIDEELKQFLVVDQNKSKNGQKTSNQAPLPKNSSKQAPPSKNSSNQAPSMKPASPATPLFGSKPNIFGGNNNQVSTQKPASTAAPLFGGSNNNTTPPQKPASPSTPLFGGKSSIFGSNNQSQTQPLKSNIFGGNSQSWPPLFSQPPKENMFSVQNARLFSCQPSNSFFSNPLFQKSLSIFQKSLFSNQNESNQRERGPNYNQGSFAQNTFTQQQIQRLERDNQTLIKNQTNLQNQMNDLRQQVKRMEYQNKNMKTSIQSSTQKNNNQEQRHQYLETQLNTLKNQNKKIYQHIQNLLQNQNLIARNLQQNQSLIARNVQQNQNLIDRNVQQNSLRNSWCAGQTGSLFGNNGQSRNLFGNNAPICQNPSNLFNSNSSCNLFGQQNYSSNNILGNNCYPTWSGNYANQNSGNLFGNTPTYNYNNRNSNNGSIFGNNNQSNVWFTNKNQNPNNMSNNSNNMFNSSNSYSNNIFGKNSQMLNHYPANTNQNSNICGNKNNNTINYFSGHTQQNNNMFSNGQKSNINSNQFRPNMFANYNSQPNCSPQANNNSQHNNIFSKPCNPNNSIYPNQTSNAVASTNNNNTTVNSNNSNNNSKGQTNQNSTREYSYQEKVNEVQAQKYKELEESLKNSQIKIQKLEAQIDFYRRQDINQRNNTHIQMQKNKELQQLLEKSQNMNEHLLSKQNKAPTQQKPLNIFGILSQNNQPGPKGTQAQSRPNQSKNSLVQDIDEECSSEEYQESGSEESNSGEFEQLDRK